MSTEPNKDFELFDVDHEDTGWVREITFFFRGEFGKMLLAWDANSGYTNFEVLDEPSFDSDDDQDAYDKFMDDQSIEAWALLSDSYLKGNKQ